jgi:hypothetical protein
VTRVRTRSRKKNMAVHSFQSPWCLRPPLAPSSCPPYGQSSPLAPSSRPRLARANWQLLVRLCLRLPPLARARRRIGPSPSPPPVYNGGSPHLDQKLTGSLSLPSLPLASRRGRDGAALHLPIPCLRCIVRKKKGEKRMLQTYI